MKWKPQATREGKEHWDAFFRYQSLGIAEHIPFN